MSVISQKKLDFLVFEIIRKLWDSNWKPDYIVCINNSGLVPGLMISEYLKVPLEVISPKTSNLWIPEDAIGYIDIDDRSKHGGNSTLVSMRKKILLIDSTNDSFGSIKSDWESSVAGIYNSSDWETVWNKNVRFAALVEYENGDFQDVDYCGKLVTCLDKPTTHTFPWQKWWK